jgi:RNA polymerase sigma-70 factor (ECF subfamily)
MKYSESGFDHLSDDQLIREVLEGRTEAFAEIIGRYQQDVARVVTALLYRRQETEELVQQVFINAFGNLKTFQPGRDFGGWIRAIARNAVREQLRTQMRYDKRLQTYYQMLVTRLNDESHSDEDQRRAAALRHCRDQLSGKAAQVIHWRYTTGRSVSEIATTLRTTANAISKLLARTRVTLRQCVERKLVQP